MEVDGGRIVLEASGLGRVEFLPEHVLAIDEVTHFPFLDWGLRIRHVRDDVDGRVEFLSRWRTPTGLRAAIARTGFVPLGRDIVPCLECGAELPEHDDRCRRCGWTFADASHAGDGD